MFRIGLSPSDGVLWQAMRRRGATLAVAAAALLAGVAGVLPVAARESGAIAAAGTPAVPLAALPAEAQDTHRLILEGGPFRYAKDGVVFGNRERLLPRHPRGHYREYTVQTPGASDRGARRIVCGGVPPTRPRACFYTDDHYSSFRRIAP